MDINNNNKRTSKIINNNSTKQKIENKTLGSIGYDLPSSIDIIIKPQTSATIPTNIIIKFYKDYKIKHYAIIKGRSSMALKGIIIHEGLIDNDYKDEIVIILFNISNQEIIIKKGQRIAQLVLQVANNKDIMYDEKYINQQKNIRNGGFGSTGL